MEEKKKNKMKGSYSLPWFKEKYGDIRFADKPTGMTIKESMMNFR